MSQATNTPAMRQSCDRCHQQKLRCTRDANRNTGTCDRCLRRRVQCVYSLSLPKGRPSITASTDEAAIDVTVRPSPSAVPLTAVSSLRPISSLQIGASTIPNAPSLRNAGEVDAGIDLDMGRDRDGKETAESLSTVGAAMMGTYSSEDSANNIFEKSSLEAIDLSLNTSPGPYSGSPGFIGDEIQMDWADHHANNGSFNWNNLLDNPPGSLEVLPDESSRGDRDSSGRHRTPPSSAESTSRSHGNYLSDKKSRNIPTIATDTSNTAIILSQLSRLNMRLAALQYFCHALVNSAHSLPTPSSLYSPQNGSNNSRQNKLLDDAAFDSVASWLSGTAYSSSQNMGSPCSRVVSESQKMGRRGVLHEAFTASHQFLEILGSLQQGTNAGSNLSVRTPQPPVTSSSALPRTSARSETTGSSSCSSSSSTSYFERHGLISTDGFPSNKSASKNNNSNNNDIYPLVMSCHTLLLNFYAAVLSALQHDATHPSSTQQMHADALGQIRLVSVVQLCSYLIGRQNQTVNVFVTLETGSPLSLSQEWTGFGSSSSSQLSAAGGEESMLIKELDKDVQGRLACLKQMLSM